MTEKDSCSFSPRGIGGRAAFEDREADRRIDAQFNVDVVVTRLRGMKRGDEERIDVRSCEFEEEEGESDAIGRG